MGLCQSKNEELSIIREQVVALSCKLESMSDDLKYIKKEIDNWYANEEDVHLVEGTDYYVEGIDISKD